MNLALNLGETKIADLHIVCISAIGIAGSSLIIPPIIAALADFIAANTNLGDESIAYVLGVLLQQRWSTASFILALTSLMVSSILSLFIGACIDLDKQRYEMLNITKVRANSVGGRNHEVYGMTSMSLSLNASKSQWTIGKKLMDITLKK